MNQSQISNEFVPKTLTIVGVGLIGGSLAAAVKQRGIAQRVIGVGRNPDKLRGAIELGLIDEATDRLPWAAASSDLIVFCTPVNQIVAGVREAASACRCGSLITDAGSTKQEICEELTSGLPPGVEFVGSHPLAGSEKSGYEHSNPNLFADKVCVVTPTPNTSNTGLQCVRSFWKQLGTRLIEMSPAAHDRAVAEISHFPHLAAAVLAATLSPENAPLAARGFKDTTRIAAGDVDVWTSILMCNSAYIRESLDKFSEILQQYRVALECQDSLTLRNLLEKGKVIRDALNQ